MQNTQRVIIDTNLWVSFLLSKRFDFIDNLLADENVQLVFCQELLSEFTAVTKRPKLKKFFTEQEWQLIFNIIKRYAIYVPVVSAVSLCRDAKDNFLLSLSKDAKADYLITGDKDLLVLKTFEQTSIVTIAEYRTEIYFE